MCTFGMTGVPARKVFFDKAVGLLEANHNHPVTPVRALVGVHDGRVMSEFFFAGNVPASTRHCIGSVGGSLEP